MKYILGDIHGCLETLKAMFNRIKDYDTYSAGDLIDKGPDSALVLDFVIEKGIKTIKGNHERFYEQYIPMYLNGEDIRKTKWFLLWGGDKTIESYKVYPQGQRKAKMKEHLAFIENLPFYFELDEVDENNRTAFVSHGFALPYYTDRKVLDVKLKQAITCNRLYGPYFDIDKDLDTLSDLGIVNIFGHDAFPEVIFNPLFIAIDTGCTYGENENKYGGKLTALEWPTKRILQEPVQDNISYSFEN